MLTAGSVVVEGGGGDDGVCDLGSAGGDCGADGVGSGGGKRGGRVGDSGHRPRDHQLSTQPVIRA